MEYNNQHGIYRVSTEGDCEGRSVRTLGYAEGYPEDIEIFYDDKKYYRITLDKIEINKVTPELVSEKKSLIHEKNNLEKRLKEIEGLIKWGYLNEK